MSNTSKRRLAVLAAGSATAVAAGAIAGVGAAAAAPAQQVAPGHVKSANAAKVTVAKKRPTATPRMRLGQAKLAAKGKAAKATKAATPAKKKKGKKSRVS